MPKLKTNTLNIEYQPHEFQSRVHKSKARFRVIPAGRKFGKTTMCVREAFNYLGKKNSVVWWCAPFQSVSMIGWRRFLQIVPPLLINSISKKQNTIEMINGSIISFKSTDNADALVGEGLDLAILDEAARIKEVVWHETIRPNLDDPQHTGDAIMISTPKGPNWFYEAYLLGQQKKFGYESWTYDYKDMMGGIPSWKNPYFTKDNLRDAYRLTD